MNNCNCTHSPCTQCAGKKCDTPCKCPVPFLGIEELCDNVSVLRFNIDGKRCDYDYTNLVYQTQSDTSLNADAINRVLTYMAERHVDSITAQELGSILHLADIGDVTTAGAEAGSMLVYQKSNTCAEGCVGLTDTWKIWNSLDSDALVSSATYPMVFDASGKPHTIQKPANPSKQYLLGWSGANQVSYITPVSVPSAPAQGGPLYYDETSGQIVVVKNN